MIKREHSTELIDTLIKSKSKFEVWVCGRSLTVNIENAGKYRFMDINRSERKKGLHLCGHISKHVAKRLEEKLYVPKNKDHTRTSIQTIYHLPDNIKHAILKKKKCWYVDINSCYFTTANIIGLVSDKFYKQGMKKPYWKEGRNMAIGSLGSHITIYRFEDGKQISDSDRIIRKTNVCRLDVIDYVWDVSNRIYQQFRKNICFYLTDAFIISGSEKVRDKLIEALKIEGYESKFEPCVLTFFDNTKYPSEVQWVRPERKRYRENGKIYVSKQYFNENNLPEA